MENNGVSLKENMQDLPLKDVEEYIEFNTNILSVKLIMDRTHEVIVTITPEKIVEGVDKLLEQNVWLEYERKALEMLKILLKSIKIKSKSQFTRIKINDFIKFSKYAFEASIERASWVEDKILEKSFKKEYNKYVSMILFILNQNVILLKKIKEIDPKDENEMVKQVRKIMRIVPKIQENILHTYILIMEKSSQEEIAKGILDETLYCINRYSSFDDI